ncbi:hypothetical protein VaNZ11_002742 [Volvox africanus]|uniref:Uncharacterized protein n=1 Tax=Volvox africanus TaxID=51714 RepID=A0ABQ5RSP3_9CHLO|nr:hypothetical protein VaNZ11_002742 [Volvox africanus]
MPASNMPSTLPAIVTPRIGPGAQELNGSYPDERGFALSGLSAASAALRGALFEATGRNSNGTGNTTGPMAGRPLSATTIALMMSPGPVGPHSQPPPLLIPVAANGTSGASTRGSPGSILGFLSGSGPGAVPSGASGGGLAQEAVQSAAALRTAAEGLVEALEAAVRAREAQNRAMLTATKESVSGSGPGPGSSSSSGRPASARALDRALAQSTPARAPRQPSAGHSGLSAIAATPTSATEERLGWVRTLVRQTEGGQAYATAAEERERERERSTTGGDNAEPATPGHVRRGPLPALRPSRREDVVLLQAWLADMLQQVAAIGAVRQQQAAATAFTAAVAASSAAASGSTAAAINNPIAAAAAAASEPGLMAQHATELADASLYVVGVAMEELRRQVAAECRERGELLGQLVDQQAALVALRGTLATEGRVADVSAQWAALLAEREKEREKERERGKAAHGAADAAPDAAAATANSVAVASSLATQLVTAHHAAEAAERRFQLADAALAGEAGRRAAAEQQLEATRELLRRQEHEWLHHRTINQRLENEVQELKDKLEAATRNAAVAEATVEAAREQTRIGRDDVSQLEAALARMRQQYEGNEILVAAQRQQIRELEAALASLREQHREQAVALGKVGKVTEKYEDTLSDLRADLATMQEKAAELEADLTCRTARLSEVEERLATSDHDLSLVRAQLSATEAEAAKAASEAETVQRQMRHEITDAVAARRQEETRRVEVEKETTAMVEMVKMLGRTMQLQGMEGVPGITDRSWETTGPLGAAQRVLGLATQHVATLYGTREDLTRELRALQVKLAQEKEVTSKLQRDLYDARTTETRMLREKEVLEMKVANLEHDLRVSHSDATKSKAAAQDSEVKLKMQHETIVGLQAQAKELVPLKKRVEALANDLDCSRRIEEELRNSLDVTRRGLEQSEEQSRYYQNEVHKLQHEVGCLQDSIKALRVKEARLSEVEALNKDLDKQLMSLKHQLDLTAESHTDTIRQLELAKFFLQGLDGSNAPGSPTRSSTSANASPSRDVRAALSPSSHSRSPSRTLTMTYNASQSGRFGSPPGRLFRASAAALSSAGPSAQIPDGTTRPTPFNVSGTSSNGANGGNVNPSASGAATAATTTIDNPSPFADAAPYIGEDGRPISAVSSRPTARVPSPRGIPTGRSRNNQMGSIAVASSFTRPGSAITEPVPEDDEYEEVETDGPGGTSEGGGIVPTANDSTSAQPRQSRVSSAGATSSRREATGTVGAASSGGRSSRSPREMASRSPRSVSRANSMGLNLETRPMSGFGQHSVVDDDYDHSTEVSTVVMDIIESRGLTTRINRATHKWSSVKIGIMAWFSRRLRERLLAVSEQLAAKDLEIAQLHYSYVNEMKQREEFICTELLPTLMPAVESGLKDSYREVQQLRAEMPLARRDLDALAGSCAVLGFSLQAYRDRETHAVCVSCQTDSDCPDDWARFANHLPPLPPRLSLSLPALVDTIVRIYVRASGTVEEVPTWGAPRHDTIHDAIMAHYTSQRAPGTFQLELLKDPESPISRLLSSSISQARNTKVAGFLYFLNLSPEGVHWRSPTWHYFLHVLHCLRVLLSGTWRIVTKRWATPEGVQIPMPAVMDLVGNLFNVQSPGDLDGALSVRLAAIVTPGVAGPAVDLDALLLLLVREYNAGNCPRNALLFPRRLTDGQLFNIFNSLGHNTHVAALKSALAGQYIGPAAPSSPTTSIKRSTSPGRPTAPSSPSRSAATAMSLSPEASAAAFGAGLLVAQGDILHPYGDIGSDSARGSNAPGSPTLPEQQLFGNAPDMLSPLPAQPQLQHGGEVREEFDAAEAVGMTRQSVRWGPLMPMTGPAPIQPAGNMTVNFQISHDHHATAVVQQAPTLMQGQGQGQAAGSSTQAWGGGAAGYHIDSGNRLTALPPPPPRPRKY